MSDLTPDSPKPAKSRARRFAPVALIAGVVASAALALSMTGTLAGFTAQITNSQNTTASGTLVMQETGTAGTCTSTDAGANSNNINTNASTCTTINKYGGSVTMVPGSVSTTTVTIKNIGTVPANTFTITPAACTQGTNTANGNVAGSATDFCSKLGVTLSQTVGGTTTSILPANSTLASIAPTVSGQTTTPQVFSLANPIAAGATASYTFTVTLNSSVGNTYQGLSASQPLAWQFTS